MIRVHVICEGQTEAAFVKAVLESHFYGIGIQLLPGLLGTSGHKGGNVGLDRLLYDVRRRLLGDRESHCTTLIDFYGLPTDFPGKAEACRMTQCQSKADCITGALTVRLMSALGTEPMRRFIPYVQMYEFEGLLFSQPEATAQAIGSPGIAADLAAIRGQFATPEEINDGPQTAPSKRIAVIYPGYEKVVQGAQAASEMGLGAIRRECPLFDAWVGQLESITRDAR